VRGFMPVSRKFFSPLSTILLPLFLILACFAVQFSKALSAFFQPIYVRPYGVPLNVSLPSYNFSSKISLSPDKEFANVSFFTLGLLFGA